MRTKNPKNEQLDEWRIFYDDDTYFDWSAEKYEILGIFESLS